MMPPQAFVALDAATTQMQPMRCNIYSRHTPIRAADAF